MKVMLIGGITNQKAEKLIKIIHTNCGKDIEVVNVNTFTQKADEEIAKENPNLIIMLSKSPLETDIPKIDGLGLMYPQMGQGKVIEAIKSHM